LLVGAVGPRGLAGKHEKIYREDSNIASWKHWE